MDLCVFIGRFRPFHNGHLEVVREALKKADTLLIVVGSLHEPRSVRNPFTYREVAKMIRDSLTSEENTRVRFGGVADTMNDELWIKDVCAEVANVTKQLNPSNPRIALIGHAKDHTSYYLNLFPQWLSIGVPAKDMLSATQLRDMYFDVKNLDAASAFFRHNVPQGTLDFLQGFINTPAYDGLVDEVKFVKRYKEGYAMLDESGKPVPRYTPTFTTVDAVVVQSGNVLMIRRGDFPGKGLWALPGGYLNPSERLHDAWLRELVEETGIKVPAPVLRGNLVANQVFDDVHRDPRGRMITHAYLVRLPHGKLPKVKGGDDAAHAQWVPLAELRRDEVYADHFNIIHTMVAKLDGSY